MGPVIQLRIADIHPAPPFGWPSLELVDRHLPTSHLDGAAWVALYQAELETPGLRRLWDYGRVRALSIQMRRGWEPDPVVVEWMNSAFALADGNHRTAAARALGRTHIPAIVRPS